MTLMDQVIEARIEKGKQVALSRKSEILYNRELEKRGVAYVHEKRIPLLVLELSTCTVVIGVEKVASTHSLFRCSYAVCSPVDNFSLRTAKGLIGNRLSIPGASHTFSFSIDTDVEGDKMVLFAAITELENLASKKLMEPTRLQKAAISGEMRAVLDGFLTFHNC